MLMRSVRASLMHRPARRLASADLFGQGDDDARGAAEVAEPEDALVLRNIAEEFGAVGAQAGDGVVDVVDGEHNAMEAQRVGRRVLRDGTGRRGGVVLGQLQLAVAVRGPHHRDVAPDAVESDGAVRPKAFDLPHAFQLHAELAEERDSRVQVVDDDGDVVHPLNGHVSEDKDGGSPLARGLTQRRFNHMVVSVQIAAPDFDRVFAALADHTRRDIVRRAISAEEGVLELAGHYPMSFAAVQKHVAVLERAGLITKQRIGRRRVVRTNLEALLVARRLLDQYEELWRARIDRMNELIAETAGAIDTVETKESNR